MSDERSVRRCVWSNIDCISTTNNGGNCCCCWSETLITFRLVTSCLVAQLCSCVCVCVAVQTEAGTLRGWSGLPSRTYRHTGDNWLPFRHHHHHHRLDDDVSNEEFPTVLSITAKLRMRWHGSTSVVSIQILLAAALPDDHTHAGRRAKTTRRGCAVCLTLDLSWLKCNAVIEKLTVYHLQSTAAAAAVAGERGNDYNHGQCVRESVFSFLFRDAAAAAAIDVNLWSGLHHRKYDDDGRVFEISISRLEDFIWLLFFAISYVGYSSWLLPRDFDRDIRVYVPIDVWNDPTPAPYQLWNNVQHTRYSSFSNRFLHHSASVLFVLMSIALPCYISSHHLIASLYCLLTKIRDAGVIQCLINWVMIISSTFITHYTQQPFTLFEAQRPRHVQHKQRTIWTYSVSWQLMGGNIQELPSLRIYWDW